MLTLTCRIQVVPEKKKEFLTTFKELIEETNKEKGCYLFTLLFDAKNENNYMLLEKWEDRAHLNAHAASEHFKRLFPKLEETFVNKMQVSVYSDVVWDN